MLSNANSWYNTALFLAFIFKKNILVLLVNIREYRDYPIIIFSH